MKWIRHSTRWAIYCRDRNPHTRKFRCLWCNREKWHPTRNPSGIRLSLDHLKPVSQGGSNHPSNLITACCACNARRRSCDWEAWCDSSQYDARVYERITRALARPLNRKLGRWWARRRPPANPWYPRQFYDLEGEEGSVYRAPKT